MSKVLCRKCKTEISWNQACDVSNNGYRCLSCAVEDYKREKDRYRELLEDIKGDIEIDYTEREIQEWPLMDVIVSQINKALEGDSK